jgi:protein-tyrosine phosphatase
MHPPGSSWNRVSLIHNPHSPHEKIYLSGVHPISHSQLKELGIKRIVNVGAVYIHIDKPPTDVEYILLNISDHPSVNIEQYFQEVTRFIANGWNTTQTPVPTLIHCYAGMSRSVTICIAYLILYSGLTLSEALKIVTDARPGIGPNDGFIESLIRLANYLNKNDLKTRPLHFYHNFFKHIYNDPRR